MEWHFVLVVMLQLWFVILMEVKLILAQYAHCLHWCVMFKVVSYHLSWGGCIFLLLVYCLPAPSSFFFFFFSFLIFLFFSCLLSDPLKVFSYLPLGRCQLLCKHVVASFARNLKWTFAKLIVVCCPCVCIRWLEIRCKIFLERIHSELCNGNIQ